MISCHAPIEDAEKDDKEASFDQLQKAIHRVQAHDMLLVIGYLNARAMTTQAQRAT